MAVGLLAWAPGARGDGPDAGPGLPRPAPVQGVPVSDLLTQIRAARAPATLLNVWATWCDPCREELPDLLRFHRAHREAGLRLVLLSADDADASDAIGTTLAEAMAKGGLSGPVDLVAYVKQDDDMKFIDALDPHWSGALPATFLFDHDGRRIRSWLAPVSYDELERAVAPRLTKPRGDAKRNAKTSSKTNTKTNKTTSPTTSSQTDPARPPSSQQPSRRKP